MVNDRRGACISNEVIAKGWPDKVMFEKMSRTGVPSARPWTGAGLWSVRNRAARQVSSERAEPHARLQPPRPRLRSPGVDSPHRSTGPRAAEVRDC